MIEMIEMNAAKQKLLSEVRNPNTTTLFGGR